MLQDLKYAVHVLLKAPGFTCVALVTLALGIGANTVIFSVVNAALLRKMPFPQADRLMSVYHSYPAINLLYASNDPGSWDYYRRNVKSFAKMAAYSGWRAPQNLTGAGNPERVQTIAVSGEFFNLLRVPPFLGRALTPQDDQPGSNREAVLSYGLWQERFGSDRGMVGRQVALNGMNYTVVGVMPSGFVFPNRAELWVPLALTAEDLQMHTEYLEVIGRLRDGVTAGEAKAEFTKITAEAKRQYQELPPDFAISTIALQEMEVGDLSKPLWVLLSAVLLVLLIACANIANLLLARGSARQRELSIRAALGASPIRLIRQLLTEGVLLALAGGVLGVALGTFGIDLLLSIIPVDLPSFIQVSVDSSVLLFTLGLSVASGLLFGIIPALHITGSRLNDSLKEGDRSSAAGRHNTRRLLAVSEIALAMVLLIGAGLMIKSFLRILRSDPGFNAEQVLTAAVNLPDTKYQEAAQVAGFFRDLQQRLALIPGVTSSGMSSMLPLAGGWTNTFFVRGRTLNPNPHAFIAAASGDYAKTLQIPLKSGRFLSERDTADSAPVAVIDENAARMYWPNQDPIGHQIALISEATPDEPVWREVVGVVGSVRHRSAVGVETKGQVYLPYQQVPLPVMNIAVRTAGDPTQVAGAVRSAVRQVDSEQPLFALRTMTSLFDEFVAEPRFNMLLLGVFAGLALLLAAVGIYAVMSYWVTQLTHEIGVRMALGARQQDVLQMVLGQAARLAAGGLALGVIGALTATRVLQSLLFQVQAHDLGTFMSIALLLAAVALVASFLPARRATRVDPLVALRYE